MSLRRETSEVLREMGVRPSRRLGQNFLVDASFVDRIVTATAPEGESVLEIGPGLGALSDSLAARARRLCLVEIDRGFAERLRSRFAGRAHVRVVHGDALEIDFDACLPEGGKSVVVANLPYSVGSQILLRLLDEHRRFSRLVLMLQREVADRLGARPGTPDYGILSVWTALRGDARRVMRVPAGAFLPRPKVDSAVVRIEMRDQPRVVLRDPARFRQIVRAGFGQRRKTLRRALERLVAPEEFAKAGIDSGRRGETLSLEEFARLADGSPAA